MNIGDKKNPSGPGDNHPGGWGQGGYPGNGGGNK